MEIRQIVFYLIFQYTKAIFKIIIGLVKIRIRGGK